MASTTDTTTPDYQTLLGNLARAIRKRRKDYPPRETARQILAYDGSGHTIVVGTDADANRVVLYHRTGRYAISVAFGSDGLADGGPKLVDFAEGPGVEEWVSIMEPYWGWLHPRYRLNPG